MRQHHADHIVFAAALIELFQQFDGRVVLFQTDVTSRDRLFDTRERYILICILFKQQACTLEQFDAPPRRLFILPPLKVIELRAHKNHTEVVGILRQQLLRFARALDQLSLYQKLI